MIDDSYIKKDIPAATIRRDAQAVKDYIAEKGVTQCCKDGAWRRNGEIVKKAPRIVKLEWQPSQGRWK